MPVCTENLIRCDRLPALSRYWLSFAVTVAGNRRHVAASAPAQVRNESARNALKCSRRSRRRWLVNTLNVVAWTAGKRWAESGDFDCCSFRSRRRIGGCEFLAAAQGVVIDAAELQGCRLPALR